MLVGKRYDAAAVDSFYDVVVIGSGMSGLATASLLAKTGRKVLVLEGHYTAGGFTHTYMRKGYEWDVGVHYVGEVHREGSLFRRAFDLMSDGRLRWARLDEEYDKVICQGEVHSFKAGKKAFKKTLLKRFPDEKKAIDRFVRLTGRVYWFTFLHFCTRLLPSPLQRLVGPLLSLCGPSSFKGTTRQVLEGLTDNGELIGVLTGQWGDCGLPPGASSFAIQSLVFRHYIDGGNYPVGGPSNIARTILPGIERSGGAVLTRAPVAQILVRDGAAVGVRLENGDEIGAGVVVSSVGVANTVRRLLPRPVRCGLERQLGQLGPSAGHICLYLGVGRAVGELGLPRNNLWICPSYDHDANLSRYLADPTAEFPYVYISCAAAKDPDWERRHPGRTTLVAAAPAPYEWFERWEGTAWRQRGAEYEAYKKSLEGRLLEHVYRYLPQIRGQVDYYELSSPLSTRHFHAYQRGEMLGLEHTPQRFGQGWLKPRTAVKNLYLTGQDIVTAGVAGALGAGVLTAVSIMGTGALKMVPYFLPLAGRLRKRG